MINPTNAYQKFLFRLVLVYLWHLVFKWGDETFHDFTDFTFRGILFSTFSIGLWVFALYLLDYIKAKFLKTKNLIPYLIFHILYGYGFALITNVVYKYVDNNYFGTDWGNIGYWNPTLTIGVTLIFISNIGIYEYFLSDIKAKESQIKAEKLQKENAIAYYKLLKAQIEPHFLFNSLSVLSSLVHKDAYLAEEFIVKLSKMMRFAVERTDVIYVTLVEELDFMRNYFFLIKTRFQESVFIDNQILVDGNQYILPPYTLQTLIENAIQHTKFSVKKPLKIFLYNDEEWIYVENNFSQKVQSRESTGIGLDNLIKRVRHLSQKEISTQIQNEKFIVKIPLIIKPDLK